MSERKTSGAIDGAAMVPKPKALPKEKPSNAPEILGPNLAQDEDLVGDVVTYLAEQLETFRQRPAWKLWVGNGSDDDTAVLNTVDRMWRVAEKRDTSSRQYRETLSDVTSHIFYDAVRTVSSALAMIFFKGRPVPFSYEPEINTDEYAPDQGQNIANYHNMLEEYTFDEDRRYNKVLDAITFNERDCNQVVCIEWAERYEKVLENVLVTAGAAGQSAKTRLRQRRRLVEHWPSFRRIPFGDIYFDAQIDGMDQQRVIAERQKVPFEDLVAMQEAGSKAGSIVNVGEIDVSHFYKGTQDELREAKMSNSGQSGGLGKDGLVEVWQVKAWLPIRRKKTKKPRGIWDPDVLSEYYWATFAGDLLTGDVVCLRLNIDPYRLILGRSNYYLMHSERDDNGAFHDGAGSRGTCLYWEACTNINQAIDNRTGRNESPIILDGGLKGTLRYRQNRVVKVARGSKVWRFDPGDTTILTLNMQDRIERDFMKLAGADRPLNAQPLGGRTSARESQNVYDMAAMPITAKAKYIAGLFEWMGYVDAMLWRVMGKQQIKLQLTKAREVTKVLPAALWGPIKIKVVAVDEFVTSTVKRQEINAIIQTMFPMAKEYMGKQGARELMMSAFKMVFPDASRFFPPDVDFEAREKAINTCAILLAGQWVEPRLEENHAVWLSVLRECRNELRYVLDEDMPNKKQAMAMIDQQIAIRENMLNQMEESARRAALAAGTSPAGLPGVGSTTGNEAGPQAGLEGQTRTELLKQMGNNQ